MRGFCGNHRIAEFHRVEVIPAECRLADEPQISPVRIVANHGYPRILRTAGTAVVIYISEEKRVRTLQSLPGAIHRSSWVFLGIQP